MKKERKMTWGEMSPDQRRRATHEGYTGTLEYQATCDACVMGRCEGHPLALYTCEEEDKQCPSS